MSLNKCKSNCAKVQIYEQGTIGLQVFDMYVLDAQFSKSDLRTSWNVHRGLNINIVEIEQKKVGSLIQQSSVKFILMCQTRKLRLHFTFGYLSTLTQQISPKSNLNRRINSDFEKKYALGKNIKLWIKKDICCGSLKGLKEILWMHKIAYVFFCEKTFD